LEVPQPEWLAVAVAKLKKVHSMLNLIKKFIQQDDGLEMVEWAIVAALITTAGAATMVSIGSQVSTQFGLILTAITAG